MTSRGQRVLSTALTLGIVAAVLVVAIAAIAKPGGDKGKPGGGSVFEISGTVDGYLYPSVGQVLPVKIENPFNSNIEVTAVTITVWDASPSCTAVNVTVGDVPAPVFIEAGEDVVVDVPIVMASDVANDCQGAVFPITYEGVATRP